tara:strand:+ start:403 stop:585 length:183 start_codon:yes stop_codon:yes gene_type:complete
MQDKITNFFIFSLFFCFFSGSKKPTFLNVFWNKKTSKNGHTATQTNDLTKIKMLFLALVF